MRDWLRARVGSLGLTAFCFTDLLEMYTGIIARRTVAQRILRGPMACGRGWAVCSLLRTALPSFNRTARPSPSVMAEVGAVHCGFGLPQRTKEDFST